MHWLARMRSSALAAALLVAAPGPAPRPAAAVAACDDFSLYRTCPPPAATCLLGPDPRSCAQDCFTCTANVDDDQDCVADEEILDDRDDDGDGLVDEDISCLNTCDPTSFACPPTGFPADAFTAPSPVAADVTFPARVDRWRCDATPDQLLDVDLELAPDPLRPAPLCGGYGVVMRLRGRAAGPVFFEGPAILLHTRRWESLERSLIAGSTGNIQVYRYLVKADLRRVAAFAELPPALQVPCSEDATARKHLFLYGYLDLARDAARPDDRAAYRTALALVHAPGRMSHPLDGYNPALDLCGAVDVSQRAIAPGDPAAHDGQGWFVVAPGDTFTFSTAVPAPTGSYRHGRIRQVASGPDDCRRETRICESQLDDAGTAAACPDRVRYRATRFCGEDEGTPCFNYNLVSAGKCDTVPGDLLAFLPVGAWSQSEFPAAMSVNLVEGSLVCRDLFTPYWYGASTRQPSSGPWLGPPDALDVVDNQIVQMSGLGEWLLGSVNWFDEGGPNERFLPRQFRLMYFFSSSNPDIPAQAPCQARAAIDPTGSATCGGGGDLVLSGAPSTVENCCQCGGLEYRWSRRDGATWLEVRGWSADPAHGESPGPGTPTEYRLEVRCSTSRSACRDQATLTVPLQPAADAGPDQVACASGPGVRIGTPGLAGHGYRWTPAAGLDDPSLAQPLATPAATTVYTVRASLVADPTCFRDDTVEVRVEPPPGRVDRLDALRRGADVHMQWTVVALASGGYHVYRTAAKRDVPAAAAVGDRVFDSPPGPASASGDHPGAVPGAAGTVFYYQVVAVCRDGVTEGPL